MYDDFGLEYFVFCVSFFLTDPKVVYIHPNRFTVDYKSKFCFYGNFRVFSQGRIYPTTDKVCYLVYVLRPRQRFIESYVLMYMYWLVEFAV